MKKILVLLLAVVMVLALAACGGNGTTPPAGNQPPTETPAGGNGTTPEMPQAETPETPDMPQNEVNGGNENALVGDIIVMGGLDWLVIKVENGQALLLSNYVLENRRFDEFSNVWETSELREFLNGEFFESTFSERERINIVETNVATYNQNNTMDNIFILSHEELSDYVEHMGSIDSGYWWLRLPAFESTHIFDARVLTGGIINTGQSHVNSTNRGGVRPAFWLNLN